MQSELKPCPDYAALLATVGKATGRHWQSYGEPEVGLPTSLFAGFILTGLTPLEPLSAWDIEAAAAAVNFVRNELPALLAEREAEVARLREALHYYADDHPMPNDGPWGVSSDDYGDKARQALGSAKS